MRHFKRSLGSQLGNKSKHNEPALIPIEKLIRLLITRDLIDTSVQTILCRNKNIQSQIQIFGYEEEII
jgi:hypothetical protein